MCKCVNVGLGTYDNQSILYYPDWFVSEKKIRAAGIDNCILEEIKSLWENGIQTVESCCGHNKVQGYIAVIDEAIPKMIALGYEHYPNHMYPDRRDEFYPKSV